MTSDSSNASTDSPDQTPSATTSDVPAFGWSGYAERVNGRFAMVGFVAILFVEAISHDTFLHWAGFLR
ncbi:chlorophyll a/b-binding protein [Synechococcus sp. W2B2]|uniref:chlorophyll a/b-binding protein n=1 Tax=unclassified Synechococcus TaxID=2626047 RepID=UPI00006BB3E8|nr:chlorophyll a/b-binding protein [Synechococcus sp. WH 7805]EAR19589.1 possible high light inducible protein [Synechococcus sp. WH 7805]